MSVLSNRIDFTLLISVDHANPNGDPFNENRPRMDCDGYGEISDVCIKRKIRNRMQQLGYPIFVQSADQADDGFKSLQQRSDAKFKGIKDNDTCLALGSQDWIDCRAFGQVFAFSTGSSFACRGPVSVRWGTSLSPIDVVTAGITKSVNGKTPTKDDQKGSDTMGQKHFVRFGLYQVCGSINVHWAEKTGFTDEDAEVLKQCLQTLFQDDASAARPAGSIEVFRLYWWKHNCKCGQYSPSAVHGSLHCTPKDCIVSPKSPWDYEITLDHLEGLEPEVYEGM